MKQSPSIGLDQVLDEVRMSRVPNELNRSAISTGGQERPSRSIIYLHLAEGQLPAGWKILDQGPAKRQIEPIRLGR
jgi:hypothetical protein